MPPLGFAKGGGHTFFNGGGGGGREVPCCQVFPVVATVFPSLNKQYNKIFTLLLLITHHSSQD